MVRAALQRSNPLAREAWMLEARCRGENPARFFPSDSQGVLGAQRICSGCDVRLECLEYALAHRIDHGIWGGRSERARKRILRRRARAQSAASAGRPPNPVAAASPTTPPLRR